MGDIFDQVAAKGDIFDTVAPTTKKKGLIEQGLDLALAGAKYAAGTAVGAGEIAANLATQTYGLPARGYAEIANLATGRTDLAEKTSKTLIYEPQTEQGKAGMDAIGGAFDWWHQKSMAVGTPVQEAITKIAGETAGNVAGATVASTMEAAPLFVGGAFGKAKGKIAERRAAKDQAIIRDTLAKEKAKQSEADLARAPLGDVIPEDPAVARAAREAATRQVSEDIFDRIQRGYLGDELAGEVPNKPLVAPQVQEYAGPRAPKPKELPPPVAPEAPPATIPPKVEAQPPTKIEPIVEAPPLANVPKEGELFPGQKKEFRLSSTEAPEAAKPFAPAPAEQPLLTGTEKAYKDVGMRGKVANPDRIAEINQELEHLDAKYKDLLAKPDNARPPAIKKGILDGIAKQMDVLDAELAKLKTPPDPVTEQVDSLRSILPDFEQGKRLWDPTGREVIGNTPNMYPPWFKSVFRNDSAKEVMAAIDKWKKGGDAVLGKKESRIMASVQDLAQDAVKRGEDIGESHWRDMLNERGSSPEVAGAARQIKEFFVPLSTMPKGKEYMALRYKDLLGGLTRVDRIVGQLGDRFKGLSVSAKADVFNAIRGEIPMDTLPAELQTISKQTRADLDRTGQMLVRRGLLKKEVFEANKDTYIHYLYLRHILPDDASIPVGKGGRLDLSYLKARKDLTESMRKELGLIEDVSIAAPVGMGKALGDVVKADFFRKVSENPDWVWQPSKEIAKLTSELKAYKQIVERGENVGPEVVAKYKQLSSDLAARSADAGKAPPDFVQLPDSKAYGELQGSFVRKEIANDIVPVYSVNVGELEGLARVWNNLGKGFDAGMTLFKVGKVALNPPTMVRNTVSNFIQMNMSGIPIYRIPSVVIDGVKSMIAKDKLFRTLERNGGFQTNFSVAELGEVLKTFQRAKGGSVAKFFGSVTDAAKYYGKIDDIAKMSLFKDAVTRQGMSVSDATMYAQKWGMDYSLASRSIKHGRRYALPFLSYQYKIAPLIAESLVKRPWVIAKYAAIPYLMARYAAEKYEWTEKDLDKAQKMMAEKTRGQGAYMILPIKDNKGNIEIANMEYFLPWGNWMEAARDMKGGDYIDVAKQFGGVLGPYGNVISMLNTKRQGEPPKDPFTGQPVYSKLDSSQDKYLKQVEWWWKLFGPSSVSSTGALGYTAKAITGAKDKWGVEATGAKAFAKWMGLNIGSLDPKSVIAARKFKIRELDAEIHRIYRDPKYSKEDRQNALRQLQIERKKILSPE